MVQLGDEGCGCIWAPDIIFNPEDEDYILHFSYSHADNDYGPKAIYYCRTRDFEHFTKPALLYRKEDSGCIDSAMYEEEGKYYLFVKSERNPSRIIQLVSNHATGPFSRMTNFDAAMSSVEAGLYEAPTAVQLADGRWCLFLDYYGVPGAGQGYVPFVADNMASGDFRRSDASFDFPYGFCIKLILPVDLQDSHVEKFAFIIIRPKSICKNKFIMLYPIQSFPYSRLQDLMIEIIKTPGMIDEESMNLSDEAESLLEKVEAVHLKLESFIDMAKDYGLQLEPPFVSCRPETPEQKEKRRLEDIAVLEKLEFLMSELFQDEEED